MKNILILLFIITIIVIVILLTNEKYEKRKQKKYKSEIFKDYDEQELKLMVGYNYVKNLSKLDFLVNEMIDSKIDYNKINYIETTIDGIHESIYEEEFLDKTTYYENEFLFKNSIINLSIIFFAFRKIIEYFKMVKLDLFNSDIVMNEYNSDAIIDFNKNIKKIEKKSKKILKSKYNKRRYYENIEKIKYEYKELIDSTNPIILMFFIKDSIKKISGV